MNDFEAYEFDRLGYLVIPQMLNAAQVKSLARAIDHVEEDALAHIGKPPFVRSKWQKSQLYHRNDERGYHASGGNGEGQTLMIEDFWNADSAFHILLNHERTMSYIRAIIQERATINNSEIRIRYTGNASGTHMGGPISHKYRYAFTGGKIDCMMVRMIYFTHDVSNEEGAFCVVPATHKTSFSSPYGNNPDEEFGMIGLEVKAGDAILFTENLRHGGLTNRSQQTRKTLHVGYGPAWMMSQNMATIDEPPFLTASTRAQLSAEQRSLLEAWPD